MKTKHAYELATAMSSLLQTKGIVGYKIARNFRMINEELTEYFNVRQELFEKYGENINGQLVINRDSENYPLFLKEIEPYDEQEVNFEFRMISEDELADSGLTAEQMCVIWNDMIE